MPRITEMFAFVVSDKGPEDEGVPAFDAGGLAMPMVGADIRRVESLRAIAQQIANDSGKQIRIYKFSGREQIGEINPRKSS